MANSPLLDLNGLVHYDIKIKEYIKDSYRTAAAQDAIDATKVDKVEGKGLSTNDYDNSAKAKVDAIPLDPKYTDTVYDDTVVKNDINNLKSGKVDKVSGKSLVSDTEIARLATLQNYDDTEVKGSISTIEGTLANKADKTEIPTKVSQLTNDSKYITNAVNDLANYYKKSETYTQEEVNQLVSAIPKFAIKVVDALPTTDISTSTIYLVVSGTESQNIYEEWIYTNGAWEKLGSQKTNLTGYATETWVESKGYLTEHQDISGKVDKVTGKSLIADSEIERLATLHNYDDTELRTDLNNRISNAKIDELFTA